MEPVPVVSIILPTRNRAALLRVAVASALRQTFRDFELIIVDDESSDETPRVVAELGDARIRYLRNDERRGAAGAVNRGLAVARADLIAFLDDDDEWLPPKLAVQVQRFAQEPPSTGVVYTGRWLVRNGTKSYGPSPDILARGGEIHRELLNRTTFVPLVCAMVRRRCFEETGLFDETLPTSNDYDFWVRSSKRYRFVYIPEPLVIVNATPGSVSTSPEGIIEARKMLLVKHDEDFRGAGRKIAAFFLWQIGSLLTLSGDLRGGRPYLARAVTRFPWNPGYLVALVVSFFGRTIYLRGVLSPVHRFRHYLRTRQPG